MIRSVVRIRDELTLDVQSDQVVVIVETVGNDIRLGTVFGNDIRLGTAFI